jgi:hypothetical protein
MAPGVLGGCRVVGDQAAQFDARQGAEQGRDAGYTTREARTEAAAALGPRLMPPASTPALAGRDGCQLPAGRCATQRVVRGITDTAALVEGLRRQPLPPQSIPSWPILHALEQPVRRNG